MIYNIIETGSAGNATILNDILLLDCGVSFNKLKKYYKNIKVVFISHIHSDHFNKTTISILAKERPALRFAVGEFLVDDLIKCGVNIKNIDVLKLNHKLNYKDFSIQPIKLYHDVENFGLRAFFGEKKAIYATDTKTLEGIKAKDYDLYLIEANYSEEEIEKRIENKKINGEFIYENRVKKTHLSLEECNQFLIDNAKDDSVFEYMHQHK